MAKTKNIITLWLIVTIGLMWVAIWAKVTLQPLYSDVRFQPTDKLHAGCTNSADILFSPQGQKITKFTLVLNYNPENVEILRILPNTNNGLASSKIEYDKIILEVKNPTFDSTTEARSFFQLSFKSDIVGKETIVLWTGSEAVTESKNYPLQWIFDLNFAKVPECEPDIIPPNLSLIYPKDTQQKISLDQYFIFDIKDIGKWIDKNSVMINFDWEQYFYGSDNLKRNGNYLTFYPNKWIPINKGLDIKISIADKQIYGWTNKTESVYTFKSATGMTFNKTITPMMFRRIAQEAEKIAGSVDECTLLADFYGKSEVNYQKELKSIIQKVGCDLTSIDGSLSVADEKIIPDMNIQQKQYRNISVFATLGWILFFITFTLKIHYMLAYRKHKKMNEKWRMKNE